MNIRPKNDICVVKVGPQSLADIVKNILPIWIEVVEIGSLWCHLLSVSSLALL